MKGIIPVRQPQIKYIYCSKPHWLDKCIKYTTLQSRRDKLKGLCFNCLQRGHLAKNCRRDQACAHCGNKNNHHHSLCSKLFVALVDQLDVPSHTQNKRGVTKVEQAMLASDNQVQMPTAKIHQDALVRSLTYIYVGDEAKRWLRVIEPMRENPVTFCVLLK